MADMNCKCDDCPAGAWHLHVTLMDIKVSQSERSLFQKRTGCKFVDVENILRDGTSYREVIPTLHHRGTLASAQRALFELGWLFMNDGYDISRLKIEGEPLIAEPVARPLYYETHVRLGDRDSVVLGDSLLPLSRTAFGLYVTLREDNTSTIVRRANELRLGLPSRIEVCVLDTAPELDERWMRR